MKGSNQRSIHRFFANSLMFLQTPDDEMGRDVKFSWMPSGKAIIFERTFRGVRNLWKMSIDPETLRAYAIERLTVGSGLDTDFAISADGRRVAFTAESDRVQAWIFPFDGIHGRLTGAGAAVTSPGEEAWQPEPLAGWQKAGLYGAPCWQMGTSRAVADGWRHPSDG